ncbi:hypothetical protein HZH68_014662 [Vespula germanica]|uniref:Uncharacterized protein n=1 Tax=Vespula germanica TaxID=30212 RepID=A0A834J9G2_VESGE|nr:hypothetical protein HZH68_014662 [Vespula germanica]
MKVKHIKSVANNKDKIIIYNDSCTGQTRNIKIALFLLKLVQSGDITTKVIEQKFLISRHSFLPNNSDFICIESAACHTSIYIHKDCIPLSRMDHVPKNRTKIIIIRYQALPQPLVVYVEKFYILRFGINIVLSNRKNCAQVASQDHQYFKTFIDDVNGIRHNTRGFTL